MKRFSLFWIVLLLLTSLGVVPILAQDTGDLHVPSPEWRDQIIYFIMVDRFNDGDPTNNDFGAGEYDPTDPRKFSGGDLQGILDELDYIQGLGATAVWITPPVRNQWWDPQVNYGGFHGYWAENFMEVDPHFGTLETYQALSRALHANDMYLIQDIVANHTGNFFTYRDGFDPDDPTVGWQPNPDTVPVTSPSQAPFDMNDPNNPEHLAAGIYYWTPPTSDYDDPIQLTQYQLADLDDLNTENPVVRDALKESYAYWIREVGVDGFRVDTIKHVEHDFWHDFYYSDNGIKNAALDTGREDFFSFGEGFYGSGDYDDSGERAIAAFLGTPEKPELDAVLQFPMHFDINRVFGESAPTDLLRYRLEITQELFPDPTLAPLFIDNHDVERFLAGGSEDGFKQALVFIMTAPGIPIIWQGSEQGFTEQRAAMFAEGVNSGGQDHFNTESELYLFIQALADNRKANLAFSRGDLNVLAANADGAGVLAYTRSYEGETFVVLYNTADNPILVQDLATDFTGGTVLENVFGVVSNDDVIVGNDGTIRGELAAREALILLVTDTLATLPADDAATVTIDTAFEDIQTEDITLSGTASLADVTVKLAIDGALSDRNTTTTDASANWSITLPIQNFPLGETEHSVQAYVPDMGAISEAVIFSTNVEFNAEPIVVSDPAGDDVGPYGTYIYPQDETFNRQMDILGASYAVSGANLMITLDMAEITTIWGPANGFDHTMFNVFIDLPNVDNDMRIMPNMNGSFSDEFAWDYMSFIEGWSLRHYSAEGADAENYGTLLNPPPSVSVEDTTISILYPSVTLGNPESLDGVRIYISTWDWNGPEGSYRSLTPLGQQWGFGGGDWNVAGWPLVMDDVTLGWEPTGNAITLDEVILADTSRAKYDVVFRVSVPDNTPDDADLYITGPFNEWTPNDSNYRFTNNGDGSYSLTVTFQEGDALEYRITRGSFANAEKYDPESRFANRSLSVTEAVTLEIMIDGWWDD